MGLRERVTITLVIIALIQIACRHCMPRTQTKASLKRYLNDVKPVKHNPAPTPYSPSRINKTPKRTFGTTAQNGRTSQTCLPKKSLYQTYKFLENEFPLDNSPRDPFHVGMTFNDHNQVYTLQKARNLHSSKINDLKKEMKMKRKILGTKQMNNENHLLKKDMPSVKFTSNHDSMRLLDSVSFPEMQYPLSTMETWGPNYWNHFPFDEEKQINGFKQQAFNNPFTRLTKAEASKYLQSYYKLKEEHMRTSTGNSKRSNGGQKGLNFTKTATCERVSDDFITASFLSNIAGKETDIKKTLEPATKMTPSLENICPVIQDPYCQMPIPYKVIEDNTQKVCTAFELKNKTKELPDLDTNDIVQTLHLLEEILLYDDTSSAVQTGNISNEIENNVNLSDSTDGLSNEGTPITQIDNVTNCTDPSTKELSQKVSDNATSDILQDITPSLPQEIFAENTTIVSEPLNVTMPFTSTEPTTNETHANLTSTDQPNVTPISNSNAVPGSTSIIIIPINNNNFDGKSLSKLLEQIMSSPLHKSVPNNQLHNDLSNIAPLQNDNPPSTALVSELLNSISDSGSSLPIYETLPTNSMCYNNESSPSAMKEKLISDILIHKSLTDDAPFDVTSTGEKLLHQTTETGNSDINTDTRSPTPDFKHPIFDFADGDEEFSLPNQGLYNNAFDNELPILAREISSDQQIFNVSSKNLFMSTQNVTSEYLHENISKDTFELSKIEKDALSVAMDQNCSFEIPTDSMTKLNNENPTEALLTSIPISQTLSDKLPEITDWKLSSSPVTTTDSAPKLLDTPTTSTNENNSPLMTDVSLKTELYKIRQILDKMLSSEIPTDSQTVPMETILSPTSDTDRLPLLVNKSLEPIEKPTDIALLPAMDKTILPVSVTDSQQAHEKLSHESLGETSSNTLLLPANKSHIPNLLLDIVDSPQHSIDEISPQTPVPENPGDNKPYLLDNLVTPLSTTHTKDIPHNDLSPTRDDLPSKMDFIIPNTYEVSGDDLPHSLVDLPIMVDQKYTSLPSDHSISQFKTQELLPQNPNFDNSVSGLLQPTKVSLASEVLEAVFPEVTAESHSKTICGFTEKVQQNFTPSEVHSSEDIEQLHIDLPLSIKNITGDVLTTELGILVGEESPTPGSDKIAKVPHTFTNTKDLTLVMDGLLSTEDTTNPDTLVTNTLQAVTLSSTNGQQSLDLAETNDELLSKPILSDITPDNLPLPEDKLIPYTGNAPTDSQLPNKKTHSTSKLPIAKALLENVLSDIRKGGLSSQTLFLNNGQQSIDLAETNDKLLSKPTPSDITPDNLPLPEDMLIPYADNSPTDSPLPNKKTHSSKLPIAKALLENVLSDIMKGGLSSPHKAKSLSATPSSLLDKTLYVVDVESPISEAKEIPPVNNILPIIETSDNLDYPKTEIEDILPVDKMQSDTSLVNIPADSPLKMDEEYNEKRDIVMDDIENREKTETLSIDKPAVDVSLQTDKVSPPIDDTLGRTSLSNQKISYSKLPITKAILEKVLSDVTSKDFALPVLKSLPVQSSSMLNKTLYSTESSVSKIKENSPSLLADEILHNTELSDNSTDNKLPSSGQTDSSPETHKNLSEVSNLNMPTELSLTDKLLSNSKDDISSPKPDLVHKDAPSDLPLASDKTLPSSKLPITKALLENVLSNIETKGFSLPGAKKNLLFEKPDNNLPSPGQTNAVPKTHKKLSEDSSLDIPVESSLTDKILPNSNVDISALKPEILHKDTPSDLPLASDKTLPSSKLPITKALLENVLSNIETKGFSLPGAKKNVLFEKQDKNLSSPGQTNSLPKTHKNLSEDSSLDIPVESTLTNKILPNSNVDISTPKPDFHHKDIPSDLPLECGKTLPSSKLPITKALLENVLSNIETKGFSLPGAKPLPVESRSMLDKTLYFIESPHSNLDEETSLPDIPNVNFPSSEITLDDYEFSSEKTTTIDNPYLNISSDELPNDQIYNEDSNETSSDYPIDDFDDLLEQVDTKRFVSDNMSYSFPLPQTMPMFASRIPITKALLQKVLSDITNGGIRP